MAQTVDAAAHPIWVSLHAMQQQYVLLLSIFGEASLTILQQHA